MGVARQEDNERNGWSDLVTTALLGTDRRPVPTELDLGWGTVGGSSATTDSPAAVLSLAAAHRAVAQAGTLLVHRHPPSEAPLERRRPAPAPAQDLLAGLLMKPDPHLVNVWLSSCSSRGLDVAAELWPRLANSAARNAAYDRVLLARTLGPRGRWFLGQNPAWRWLTEAATVGSENSPPVDPTAALASAEHEGSPSLAIEMVLACPDPLPTRLVLAAVGLIASGALGADTRAAAGKLSYRIPLQEWSDLSELVGQGLPPRRPVPAVLVRTVQFSLDLIERTVRARVEIDDAFIATPEEETSP